MISRKEGLNLVGFLLSKIKTKFPGLKELASKHGAGRNETGVFQIRFAQLGTDVSADEFFSFLSSMLKGEIRSRAVNSGSFPSFITTIDSTEFEFILSKGQNKGEAFEKTLLEAMQRFLKGEDMKLGKSALAALAECDERLKVDNLIEILAREGKVFRKTVALEQTGSIIGDIILRDKQGKSYFISVKNTSGSTVGSLGISKAFNGLKINRNTEDWRICANFGFCADHFEHGLDAYVNGTEDKLPSTHEVFVDLDGDALEFMLRLWGINYFYLRENRKGFIAKYISKERLLDHELKNLKVTTVKYPNKTRKGGTVTIVGDHMKYYVHIRNAHGKIVPSQIQLSIA